MSEKTRKCMIPFKVIYSPIKALALIPFEKKPDEIYRGFELQYIDGCELGKGYRVIAYRNDSYVDVYDDSSLIFREDERFDVAEKGLNKHLQTPFANVSFTKDGNCQIITFSFRDLLNRKIDFEIREYSTKNTTPMNLLAPIGYGSEHPNYLPLFFMYDFDFIRKKKTKLMCTIDGTNIEIDGFPFPMNMQARYYARYSNHCELIEFANSNLTSLLEVEVCGDSYFDHNVEYQFDDMGSLQGIIVHIGNGKIEISFTPHLTITSNSEGTFKITPNPKMGYLEGRYAVAKTKDKIALTLTIPNGWIPVPTSLLTKLILNPKSIFCKWSSNYIFTEEFDIPGRSVKAKWINRRKI